MKNEFLTSKQKDEIVSYYRAGLFSKLSDFPNNSFKNLLTWEHVNQVLSNFNLYSTKIRLYREGQAINPIQYSESLENKSETKKFLNPDKFYSLIEEGATLVINGVDELVPELSNFSMGLERLLETNIRINAYVSWKDVNGFDIHWDHHDVFIIQLIGRKSWRIHEKTREYPMFLDFHDPHPPYPKQIWQDSIDEGTILYIPRGYWHYVKSVNEPSLHLTVTLEPKTAKNYLSWLENKLLDHQIYRMDLPKLTSPNEVSQFEKKLVDLLFHTIKQHGIQSYLEEKKAARSERILFSLPFAVNPQNLDGCQLVLNTRSLSDFKLDKEGKYISFSANDKDYKLVDKCESILRLLMDYEAHLYEELLKTNNDLIDKNTLDDFLFKLIREGLIAVIN